MHKLATARLKKFGRLNDGQENFVVSDFFKTLSDGKIFYRGEDSLGNHYFATKKDILKIVENREFFFDSTFLPVAKISFFYQLSILSIRETLENDAILSNPLIFILNRNKKTQNYESIFNYIKELTSQTNSVNQIFSPSVFHVDFELGQKKAINKIFTDCEINHCFFHFLQSLRRNLCKKGFQNKMDPKNESFCPHFLQFWNFLSGIPSANIFNSQIRNKIQQELEAFCEKLPLNNDEKRKFSDFLSYFDQFYFNDNAFFPRSTWCQYNNILQGINEFSRTTNISETLHAQLNQHFKNNNSKYNLLKNLLEFKESKNAALAATKTSQVKVGNEVLEFSPAKKILSKKTDRIRLLQIYNLVFSECRKSIEDQLAGLKTFLTKVGGQRRTFYEGDPILVEKILGYDDESESRKFEIKRPF